MNGGERNDKMIVTDTFLLWFPSRFSSSSPLSPSVPPLSYLHVSLLVKSTRVVKAMNSSIE